MIRLTALERQLWSEIIVHLSEQLSSSGCNDFVLENTPESQALLRSIIQYNYKEEQERTLELEQLQRDIDEGKSKIYTYDFLLLSYLQNKVNEILDETHDGT